MKVSVQVYGMIVVFSLMILIIPELLTFSIYYSHMNELAAYTVELIEVNEGINDRFLDRYAVVRNENPGFEIDYIPEEVNDGYKVYKVTVSYNLKLPVLNFDYNLSSEKISKRVIY